MQPLFVHEPLAWAVTWAGLIGLRIVESRLGGNLSSKGDRRWDWSLAVITVLLWCSLAGAIPIAIAEVAPIAGASWWPVIAGNALIWAGLGLRIWSIVALGRFFKLNVAIQDGHRVVDRGPYRLLRHPSYLGMIVAMTGLGLTTGDWVSTALMLAGTLLAFMIRIRVEERLLLRALGDEYAAYARRTARLVPGVF